MSTPNTNNEFPNVNVVPNDTRDDVPTCTDPRQPTVQHLTMHQRVYGPHDQKRIQKSAVQYIRECCGDSYLKFYEGGNHAYSLEPILVETKKKIAPLISTRQLRRWFYYAIENGQTKAEVNMSRKLRHDYRRRVVYTATKNKKKAIGLDTTRDI